MDDVHGLFEKVLACDLLVFAAPTYSWYCTPPMKALLDRLVYGMNKYYGEEKGPSLWAEKSAALIAACGYPIDKGADLWENGMKRYCRHSHLHYIGMLAEHDRGYQSIFMTEEKERHAILFAKKLAQKTQGNNIERVLVIESSARNISLIDEMLEKLKDHPDFEILWLKHEPMLSLPGLEIDQVHRKVYTERYVQWLAYHNLIQCTQA